VAAESIVDDSGPGTADRPFATLDRARVAAVSGTVVNLRAGTYRRSTPFQLSVADSGVIYQAYGYGTAAQEKVVISGGRRDADPGQPPAGVMLFDNTTLVQSALVDDPTVVDIVAEAGVSNRDR
jgi:hypothetical protein